MCRHLIELSFFLILFKGHFNCQRNRLYRENTESEINNTLCYRLTHQPYQIVKIEFCEVKTSDPLRQRNTKTTD